MPTPKLLDPVLAHAIHNIRGPVLGSYLIALAGFQRGLAVNFHRTAISRSEEFTGPLSNGTTGVLFSLSDRAQARLFNGSLSDTVPLRTRVICARPDLQRQVLEASGLRMPRSLLIQPGEVSRLQEFLENSQTGRYVVRSHTGQLFLETCGGLDSNAIQTFFKARQKETMTVEDFISGKSLKIFVVGDQCITALLREHPHVLGDGRSNVKQLLEAKNSARAGHPVLFQYPVDLDDEKRKFMKNVKVTLAQVPKKGQQVQISAALSTGSGAEFRDVTGGINENLARVAIATCKALELPIAEIDIIVSEDTATKGAHILSVNPRPNIALGHFSSFDGRRESYIAEAVVDHCFPGHPQLFQNAGFDPQPIVKTMGSTQVNELSLPILRNDWKHLRIKFTKDSTKPEFLKALVLSGAYLWGLQLTDGRTLLDMLISPEAGRLLQDYKNDLKSVDAAVAEKLYAEIG